MSPIVSPDRRELPPAHRERTARDPRDPSPHHPCASRWTPTPCRTSYEWPSAWEYAVRSDLSGREPPNVTAADAAM